MHTQQYKVKLRIVSQVNRLKVNNKVLRKTISELTLQNEELKARLNK